MQEPVNPLSPVWRLTKGYANQKTDGTHMVDLIDHVNGYVICRCVYEPYADEILGALRAVDPTKARLVIAERAAE